MRLFVFTKKRMKTLLTTLVFLLFAASVSAQHWTCQTETNARRIQPEQALLPNGSDPVNKWEEDFLACPNCLQEHYVSLGHFTEYNFSAPFQKGALNLPVPYVYLQEARTFEGHKAVSPSTQHEVLLMFIVIPCQTAQAAERLEAQLKSQGVSCRYRPELTGKRSIMLGRYLHGG